MAKTVAHLSNTSSLVILMCLVLARALPGQGGPPLETDDPGTPGPGHVELNISVEGERQAGGSLYDAPRLDANVGVGTRMQLKFELPWRVATAPAGPTRSGVGNMLLGVKWRFAQLGTVAVSTYPSLALGGSASARAKGLADSGATLLVPIEIAWDPGPVSLDAEAGYQRGQGVTEVVYGLAVARSVRPSLELLGECHGSAKSALAEEGVLCGAGFRWALESAMSLLAAYTTAVAGSVENRPDRRLYAGAQLRW
jgi:hypothetical protein